MCIVYYANVRRHVPSLIHCYCIGHVRSSTNLQEVTQDKILLFTLGVSSFSYKFHKPLHDIVHWAKL